MNLLFTSKKIILAFVLLTQNELLYSQNIPTLHAIEKRTIYMDKTKQTIEVDRETCNLTIIFNLKNKEIEMLDRATSLVTQWFTIKSKNTELSNDKEGKITFNCVDRKQVFCYVSLTMGGNTFATVSTIYKEEEHGGYFFHNYKCRE